ncbi:accessory gene regulator ArgB-like protein [Ruminiclostridium cellobioparum]|uniref:Accessory gene regulator B protein n=1 Tax=Ruminiclostridium cellobioparum subsp. termitidis CT1112 TaxID=1195236 RepID=S0FSJ5_RUMCE|nr:accessory gene regulator AgrB [Ruminiclostridium cellobioparum]EMS71473.1 accessory gene regulator B protein [Ruminiclostridium cellobioparum subsp. termitidis CT1112]
MLNKITKKITNEIIVTVPNITEEKAEQIQYGLYIAISDGLKLIAVMLTAYFLGQLPLALAGGAVFALNKSFLGGVHAKTQLGCIITYFIFLFGAIYSSKIIDISYFNIILFVVSGILVYFYAPADLASKPIITEKRWKELRAQGSITVAVFFIITFFVPREYSNVISIITLINSINITPVLYRITKNRKGGIINEKI